MTDRRLITSRTAAVASLCGVCLGASGVAYAAGSWPLAGGDPGRSGNQPLSGGPGVMSPMWTREFADGKRLQGTAIVTRAGFADASPRVVYGTQDGRVHLHDVYTGAAVGPDAGIPLLASLSPDPFGGPKGGLTAVDTTDKDGYGQLFVVHNDDDQADPANTDPKAEFPDDIAIAQIDTQTGRLIKDLSIPGTDGYTVSAPPLLTEPNDKGDRFLIFTAVNREDWEKQDASAETLNAPQAFSIPLKNARKPDAKIDLENVTTASFDTLNPLVAPALLYLADELAPDPEPGETAAAPVPWVAFATADPDAPLQLLSPDLADTGPSSPRLDRDATATRRVYVNAVAIPVGPTGQVPGTKDSKVLRAPALIVTSYDTGSGQTTVHRLVPSPDGTALLTAATSAVLNGRGGPLLATSQLGGGAGVAAGRIVVGTGKELVGLRGSDLVRSWRLDPAATVRTPGADGFQSTGPTLVGDAALLLTDAGQPLAVDRDTGATLPGERFTASSELAADKAAVLSPAAGSGVAVFAGDRGLTVYRTACGNRVDGTDQNETLPGSPTGDDVRGRGGIDLIDLRDGDDCAQGASGNDRIDGGTGKDDLDGGAGDDLLIGGTGDDRLLGAAGLDTLLGGAGDDTLLGGLGEDLMKGADGNDLLQAGDGNDRVNGGDGNDRLEGGAGIDRMKGNAGDDTLVGGDGRDKLDGGAGNDSLDAATNAGSRGNELIGAGGDDSLLAANGVRDVVRCGAGTDTAEVDQKDRVVACERVTVKTVVLPGAKKPARKKPAKKKRKGVRA